MTAIVARFRSLPSRAILSLTGVVLLCTCDGRTAVSASTVTDVGDAAPGAEASLGAVAAGASAAP